MSDIQDALEKLGQAHGQAALIAAFQRLGATLRRDRKRQASEYGTLAQTIHEAMRHRDDQRAAGATPEELATNLERTVRACWPVGREWKFLCQDCRDYGLRMSVCPGDATCGRDKPHRAHDFGTPCWCDKGTRFREKVRTDTSAIEAAARVKKPMTRFGR